MKQTRRRAILQPSTGIDRAALLLAATPRRKPRKFERPLQASIVRFHADVVVNPLDAVLFAVPNGEDRDPEIGAILSGRRRRHPDLPPETDAQAMLPAGQGLLPGVVDLVLLLGGPRTVLLEVKAPRTDDYRGGVLNHGQQAFQRAVLRLGFDYRVVESVDDYRAVLVAHSVQICTVRR